MAPGSISRSDDVSRPAIGVAETPQGATVLDMDRYQWMVLFAAWLGWGFDIFDSLLFNYVAPTCVPVLLGIPFGTPAAAAATLRWTGILTSLLLVGWATGGIIFGRIADRLGRTRTLLLTMAMYSLGTAACALAQNMWSLVLFRVVASLGIGGEWVCGAAMVAEIVPEKRRVDAGALLYSAAPMGLFLATFLVYEIQGVYFRGVPEVAWRYVFLSGLIPAIAALGVRLMIKEPERWKHAIERARPATVSELFTPAYRALTFSGASMAMINLLVWWSVNAFIPVVAVGLANRASEGASTVSATVLAEQWKAVATNAFGIGTMIGVLLTIPAAKYLGRRNMYILYFVGGAISIMAAFGLPLSAQARLYMYFPIGITVWGITASFAFYLPELFPTRLRGTGSGFCFNLGRDIAAVGPFVVGGIAARGANALDSAMQALFYCGFIPLVGLLLMPWVIETKDRLLPD
jgi:MFS family permease